LRIRIDRTGEQSIQPLCGEIREVAGQDEISRGAGRVERRRYSEQRRPHNLFSG
jgi:hypothetical protein